MAPSEPEVFDVVIFGASGFTGKYVIREALKFLNSSSTSPLRSLAVAGRSRDRMAAARRWAVSSVPPPDTSDAASLAALAARARVMLSCAGPFRLHGHAVAAACAAAGADCLDISGEPEFMEHVEAELNEAAARAGSLIVSACGFDSVPAELCFLFHSGSGSRRPRSSPWRKGKGNRTRERGRRAGDGDTKSTPRVYGSAYGTQFTKFGKIATQFTKLLEMDF